MNIVLCHEVDEAWIVSQLAKDNRRYSDASEWSGSETFHSESNSVHDDLAVILRAHCFLALFLVEIHYEPVNQVLEARNCCTYPKLFFRGAPRILVVSLYRCDQLLLISSLTEFRFII